LTDRPYTDDDLRAEAARQLANLPDHLNADRVGQEMCGAEIESMLPPAEADGAEGAHWEDVLGDDAFAEAERSIHGLIKGAADVSGWAVDIGADGLEPEEHSMTVKSAGRPIARAYFAFAPDVSESMREAFVTGIGEVAAHQLRLAQEEAAAVTIPSEPAAHVLFQERLGGWPPSTFAAKLLNLWTSADTANAECLATAFPEYAAAIALVKSGPSGIEQLRAIADGT
jgi:hypothetical protein